jgi:hypothetical protein
MCVCVCGDAIGEDKLHTGPEVLLRDHHMHDNPLDKIK